MIRDVWNALTKPEKRAYIRGLTPSQRLNLYVDLLASTTPGDNLPYPSDYNDPADSPSAFRALAEATQTALDVRMPVAGTTAALASLGAGWVNNNGVSYHGVVLYRFGKIVIAHGMLLRTADLTVADNTLYPLGTVPAGFRPVYSLRFPITWVALTGGINNMMATQADLLTDGTLSLVANVDGAAKTNHWVSLAGAAWVTP